jgi:hypothetical protein
LPRIEHDTFKDLTSLRSMRLDLAYLGAFIRENGIEWMRSLNYYHEPFRPQLVENDTLSNATKFAFDHFSIVIEIGPSSLTYAFPDADFCTFASYPHEKLIFTAITDAHSNCSCKVLWLYKYIIFYRGHRCAIKLSPGVEFNPKCMLNDTARFTRAYLACRIPERISRCKLQSRNATTVNRNRTFKNLNGSVAKNALNIHFYDHS